MQDFLEQYRIVVFNKFAQFTGRAGRKEFWMFFLVNILIGILLGLTRIQALGTIYTVLVFIPGLAVAIRRMHDTNRSGWFLLLGLIPVVGQIILLVLLAQETSSTSTY